MALQIFTWRLFRYESAGVTITLSSPLIVRVMKGMYVYHVSAISHVSLGVS